MNFHTEMRKKYLEYLAKNSNIPEYIKPELRDLVVAQVNAISVTFGTTELMWRRLEPSVGRVEKCIKCPFCGSNVNGRICSNKGCKAVHKGG